MATCYLFYSCLRRSRETGTYEDEELEKEEDLFEYVDEKEYAKIVQKRQQEGFILDDGTIIRGGWVIRREGRERGREREGGLGVRRGRRVGKRREREGGRARSEKGEREGGLGVRRGRRVGKRREGGRARSEKRQEGG